MYVYIYSCVVISIHIQERITHGGAKKELLHHLTQWDLAWPRVTKVVDLGLQGVSDRVNVFKPVQLTAEQKIHRMCDMEDAVTLGSDSESESVQSSCSTEALPSTSPPKKRRVT